MELNKTSLSSYDNGGFSHGKSIFIRFLWIITSCIFFETSIPYPYSLKRRLLRLFGAHLGNSITLKPNIRIKQPWLLEIDDHCWLGEGVWIDNLVLVQLAKNVCLSQGVLLLTGNHDYKKSTFDLVTGEIHLEDGVWIGARAMIGPGVTCHTHSILTAGSAAFKNLNSYGIYQGNTAVFKRRRIISSEY